MPLFLVAFLFPLFLAHAQGSRDIVAPVFDKPLFSDPSPQGLKTQLDGIIGKATEGSEDKPLAILVPHAAYAYCAPVLTPAFRVLQGQGYTKALILAPLLTENRTGLIVLGASQYKTPLGVVPVATADVATLSKRPGISVETAVFEKEQAITLQIPLLQRALGAKLKINPILVGRIGWDSFSDYGNALLDVIDDETIVVVASNISNYGVVFGYTPVSGSSSKDVLAKLQLFDDGIIKPMVAADFPRFVKQATTTKLNMSGLLPVTLFMNMLEPGTKGASLAYGTSYAAQPDEKAIVSYAALRFDGSFRNLKDLETTAEEKKELLRLTRDTLRSHLYQRGAPRMQRYKVSGNLSEYKGIFVSFREKNGKLRNALGYVFPALQVYDAAMKLVVLAAQEIGQEGPITMGNYENVRIEINVVDKVTKITNPSQIDLGKQGIFMVDGKDTYALIPQIATDAGLDRIAFASKLCEKAALDASCWKKKEIFGFTTERLIE